MSDNPWFPPRDKSVTPEIQTKEQAQAVCSVIRAYLCRGNEPHVHSALRTMIDAVEYELVGRLAR